jgi:hypothetical protein
MLDGMSEKVNTSLAAALTYIGLGWEVIPLHNLTDGVCSCPKGKDCGRSTAKHPRTVNWNGKDVGKRNGHSSDPEQLRKWWRSWPLANLGVLTGPESGIFDLECEEEGLADLAALQQANAPLPRTPQAQSGHGGLHHIFRWPADGLVVTTGSHIDKRPIDTRGRGGQFVAPPSRNKGGLNRWVVSPFDVEPAEAPEWLLAWLEANGRLERPATGNGKRFTVRATREHTVEERAVLWLGAVPPAISDQGGHAQTFAAARGVVLGFDLGPDVGFELLRDHYNPRCVPEWSEKELRHKCQDAHTKPFNKPRGYLLNGSEANGRQHWPASAATSTRDEDKSPATPPDPWPEPVPLSVACQTPAFPLTVLPRWLAAWVDEEARATQTPTDLAGMLALVLCGAALAKKFRVLVRPGWSEPTNLFGVVALPPGDRKSAVFAQAMKPVHELELAEQARLAQAIAEAASERRVLEAALKAAEQRAAKAEPKDRDARRYEAKEAARQLARHVLPFPPQLFCDDETTESLSRLLAQQGGRMLQASAEGTAFEIAKGRYSESANFDVYLKGHAGDPLRVGRISREGETVPDPALSLALTVQPDVIAGLAEAATMRRRGFLARFFYSLPVSLVGRRKVGALPVSPATWQTYCDRMRALWLLSGTVGDDGQPSPHWLRMSPEADEVLRDLERWLEPQLAEGEELSLLAGWAAKLAGGCARVAAILHVAEAIGNGEPWDRPISADIVNRAVRLGRDYLLKHALAAFALMGADERLDHARAVLRSLPELVCVTSVTSVTTPPCVRRREVHRKHHRRFVRAEDLDPVLDLLARHGWIQPTGEGKAGRGGQPSPTYWVHPDALKDPCAQTRYPGDTGDTGDTDG